MNSTKDNPMNRIQTYCPNCGKTESYRGTLVAICTTCANRRDKAREIKDEGDIYTEEIRRKYT